MISVKTICHKTDFLRNCIAELTAYILDFILNSIFKPSIEVEISEQHFFALEKNFVLEGRFEIFTH